MGGGGARIVKEDNFCGMEDNQVRNEDDLRRDAPVLKVGDRSKETWRVLNENTVPEASGVTPDTWQEESDEGGAEEFSVLHD